MLQSILLILFFVAALFGVVNLFVTLRKVRAERQYLGALVGWNQPLKGFWRFEPEAWLAVNLHRLGVLATASIGLYLLIRHPEINISLPGIPALLVPMFSAMILAACVAFSGLLWGQSLVGQLVGFRDGVGYYALAEEGVLYGGKRFNWKVFSGWSMNDERTLIQLWSRRLPGAVAFSLLPPSPAVAAQISELLDQHLPGGRRPEPGGMQRAVFALLMLGQVILCLAAALILASLSPGIALTLNAFLVFLLVFLGERTIMGLIYDGQNMTAPLVKG